MIAALEDLRREIAGLRTNLDSMTTAVAPLPEAVNRVARRARRADRMQVLVVVLIVLVGVVLWGLRRSLMAGAEQRRILIECTTPGPNPPPVTGHPCYDDGVARTSAAITALICDAHALAKAPAPAGVVCPAPSTTSTTRPHPSG
jgi:hypothetical protein